MPVTTAAPTEPEALRAHPLLCRALDHVRLTIGKHWEGSTQHDRFVALALATRDAAVEQLIATQSAYASAKARRVYYLSLEFLIGRQLRANLVNLGQYTGVRDGLAAAGANIDEVLEVEPDPGLGNGGLGRLAACYLDSAATLGLPVYGYGLRYDYGIFEQRFVNGWQVEEPEYWLQYGSPWELVRPEYATAVRLYGHVEHVHDRGGRFRPLWRGYTTLLGVPYDIPIVGYGAKTVNILRLWSARAARQFDLEAFNRGGFVEAVRDRVLSETITKVLYPADEVESGRILRFTQQYFFVACTLADILRRFDREHDDLRRLPDKVTVQMNDTHPALAVAELMRVLIDERGVTWDNAWEMTQAICGYTNHTLLPEALEQWPVAMFERVLPRHLEIIYEINSRFLSGVSQRYPHDGERLRRVSLIGEGTNRTVRMAHLAMVGSHKVNGVAELHSRLLRERVMPDFAALWPERFTNVTNGVTPRRWLLSCNPDLADAITERIGDGWIADLPQLRKLAPLADDAVLQSRLRAVKAANKERLARWVHRTLGMRVDPAALFDVQVKRLHEYKRQLMNVLHVVMLYHELIDNPKADRVPRVVFFAAKAAPSYHRAKQIIKLIHDVAATLQRDGRIAGKLRIIFLPNYNVSLAERIIPAADLSEQISTAGMEASGTGNMKLALNGALTIGTLDGANVEIRAAVGETNFFLFGATAEQVPQLRQDGTHWQVYRSDAAVRRALDDIAGGAFNPDEPELHRPIREWLTAEGDPYLLLSDVASYAEAQRRVEALWRKPAAWSRAVIHNIAHLGHFSSDRSVAEYAERIWRVEPLLATDE